jgi:hypothetical protein
MKRKLLILTAFATMLVCMPAESVHAKGFGKGHGRGVSHSRGGIRHTGHHFNGGFGGFGGCCGDVWGFAELYRELLNNVPYYALHPPVYYSYPVPRTYGYSPFAYPGYIMTPEGCEPEPLEIINPHVPAPQQKPASVETERAAAFTPAPEPLVIFNTLVPASSAVAKNAR